MNITATELAYLGNLSASSTTQLTPSRTNADAVYEPPGPPPTTSTVVSSGIDMSNDKISMLAANGLSFQEGMKSRFDFEKRVCEIDPIPDCQDSLNQYCSMIQNSLCIHSRMFAYGIGTYYPPLTKLSLHLLAPKRPDG